MALRTLLAFTLLLAAPQASAAEAWVSAERANIRLLPQLDSPIIGLVEKGDRVQLMDSGGSLQAGWTLLRPLGAVRSRLLVVEEPGAPQPVDYVYARVIVPSALVRAQPAEGARIVARHSRGHILAFKSGTNPGQDWLERPDGSFVARRELKLLAGSTLHGVFDPPAVLAFILKQVHVQRAEAPDVTDAVLERYTAVPVEAVVGRRVWTAQGPINRGFIRLARAVPRPEGLGATAKWIHVDTGEQVLTAYEGDRLVFATLVSTGRTGWETPNGHFRVWYKLRHGAMRGHRASYLVEEVPHSLFFGADTALHGVTWHDRFGTPVSHGCINLSPADAAWLFQWAPPTLPEGWHGILPGAAGLETLWVIVESSTKGAPSKGSTALSANLGG